VDLNALSSSLIGATVVALVNYILTLRRDLFMKRELYREVLYREKVAAYGKVYALAAGYIHDVKHPTALTVRQIMETEKRALLVKKEIENSGLFMPLEVMDAIGGFDEISDYIVKNPALAKARFQLDGEPTEDILRIMTWADQFESVCEILRDDLGVEELTADLNEFFRTASRHPVWVPKWLAKLKQYRNYRTGKAKSDHTA